MKQVLLYIHGKGGNAREASRYRPLCPAYEVVGVDYQGELPWQVGSQLRHVFHRIDGEPGRQCGLGGGVCRDIEGGESGGHIGELTTMTLVPQVCDAVNIPVLAAGGIADGRGIAAALMLGACGVQCGTRFLVAEECTVHQNYKNKILKAKDIDTIATGKRLGHPVRCLKNPFTRDLFKQEYNPNISDEELEKMGAGALRKAAKEGDEKNGSFMAGQCAAMVHKEQPAKEMIEEMFAEAEQILRGASQFCK